MSPKNIFNGWKIRSVAHSLIGLGLLLMLILGCNPAPCLAKQIHTKDQIDSNLKSKTEITTTKARSTEIEPDQRGWNLPSLESPESTPLRFNQKQIDSVVEQIDLPPSFSSQRIPSSIRDALPILRPSPTPSISAAVPIVPEMTEEVRQQIGLASYTENVATVATERSTTGPSAKPSADVESAQITNNDQDPAVSADFPQIGAMLTSADNVQSTLKLTLLVGILSLAPAIILMTTCYIRVMVVLTLLKQAFGAQQLPPMQVLSALSLFLTFLIMAPVWYQIKSESLDPYTEQTIDWDEAWQRGAEPIKQFMIRQIEATGNEDSVAVFYQHLPDSSSPMPDDLRDVPINVLIPAFMISELKIAFLLGFQIFLPFLVLDLVVSSVTVSMGMLMLPPQMVSFPLKLILFVLVDGWNLVVGLLLQSFV